MKRLCSDCDRHFIDSLNNLDGTLIIAAWRGHVNCVRTLIEAGADVNSPALTSAVIKGREECVNLLLESGADVNAQSDILFKAATYGREKWVEFLIKKGADVNHQNSRGNTALMRAAELGQISSLQLLLKAGADVNKAGCDGSTALTASAQSGKRKCLKLLIKTGADVNKARDDGSTALTASAKLGKLKCVELLIKAGADVNTKNLDGYSVLMIAAEYQHTQCVESVLHAGALVNVDDFHNELTEYIIAATRKPDKKPNRKLCMLLFAAGVKLQMTSEGYVMKRTRTRGLWPTRGMSASLPKTAVPEYLINTKPGLRLKEKCREVIREHLLELDQHENLFVRVPRLGLPSLLAEYLLYGF